MKSRYITPKMSFYIVSPEYSVLTANHGAYSGTAAFQSLGKERAEEFDSEFGTGSSEGTSNNFGSDNGPWESLW